MSKQLICALIFAAANCISSWADDQEFSIEVTAESEGERASASWSTDAMEWDESSQTWHWSLKESFQLTAESGRVLGTLQSAAALIDLDPVLGLAFAVQAADADTVIRIRTSTLQVEIPYDAIARATMALTLTDTDEDGAVLEPHLHSGATFESFINGKPFAELVHDELSAPPGKTVSLVEAYPEDGFVRVEDGWVGEMSAGIEFELSAHDLASGSSYFEVTAPEPSSWTLWLVAALLLRRRT